MKRLLLGIFMSIGITSIGLPVLARVTSVVAHKKISNSICLATNSDKTRCHSNVITITENSSFQPELPEEGASMHVCSLPQPAGYARCHSVVLVDNSAKPLVANNPSGYGPTEFRTAYQLTGTAKAPTTIAIVDAYDSPTIENDLNVYSQTYGLPPCTTNNGCFTKVNQSGQQNNYPQTNNSWALEISLDVEVAHAICQNCKILLVEANSNSFSDLGNAENTAAHLGATVISNSYGGKEFQGETAYDYYFYNHPGITITVSSGDNGYGVQYPAASPYVTAVGGTTLSLKSDNTRNNETVWGGSGSGCSVYEPKPGWQIDNGCNNRTVVDVSADADPNTGAAVYDSTGGNPGWIVVGGTSLSAPLVAGIYALAGNSGSSSKIGASYLYSNTSVPSLYNITTGSNGNCGSYLCTGGPIYNGPTGLGTPIGTGAF